MRRLVVLVAALAVVLAAAPPADALAGSGSVAALQLALRTRGLYHGDLDGIRGPGTVAAVRVLQRRRGLAVDGIAGRRTRRALGHLGRPVVGARVLRAGRTGFDVAALQFLLGRAGFPSGDIDGGLGAHTVRALRKFQARAGLPVDGVAGPATFRALRRPSPVSPIRLARPVRAPIGDGFGMRGTRLHAGLDFPAPTGTPVTAAGTGRVVTIAFNAGGWGRYVVIAHGAGVQSLYAHLSAVSVGLGQRVVAGTRVGSVGSSGLATGPHLHFEVFVRGANVDPLTALG